MKQGKEISISVALCALAATLLVPLAGCNEDVTAVLGTDVPFSLFGVLSPQLDSQWVRVYPIEETLVPSIPERLDARFESTDLQSGQSYVWRDSIIQDVLDQEAHVFWVPIRVEHEHTYRLEVRRSDGATSHLDVTVPPRTELVTGSPTVSPGRVRIPISVVGQAPRLNNIEVVYSVSFQPVTREDERSDRVAVSYDGEQQRTDDGWEVSLDLADDFRRVGDVVERRLEQPFDRGVGLILTAITLRLIVANEEWNPPGGVFDPTVLVQPGTMSNVVNGFGFVGAGYRLEEIWLPAEDVIRAAGFRAP